jgi:hypothetical protein
MGRNMAGRLELVVSEDKVVLVPKHEIIKVCRGMKVNLHVL